MRSACVVMKTGRERGRERRKEGKRKGGREGGKRGKKGEPEFDTKYLSCEGLG